MPNRKFLSVAVLSGLLAAGCGGSPGAATSSSSTTSSELTTTTTTSTTTTTQPGIVPAVGLKTYVTSVNSPSLVANISYPVLGGMASSQIQASINSSVYKAVEDYVSSFETELESANLTPVPGSAGGGASSSEISGSFTKELVDSRYASFRFLISTAASGAASPTTEAESLTFDLNSGRLLSLSDLFSSSNYLSTLSSLAKSAITAKLGQNADQAFINNGAQPNAANFASWNLTGTEFELTFSQGQVAPMASGVVTVLVPYSALSGIAKNPGPLTNP